jgi:hypothetical protein
MTDQLSKFNLTDREMLIEVLDRLERGEPVA